MPRLEKQNIIFTNRDERPSRFLVDLNRKLAEKNELENTKNKPRFSFFSSKEKKKQVEVNDEDENEIKYSEIKRDQNVDIYSENLKKISNNLKNTRWYASHEERLNRLAFLPLIKFILKSAIFLIKTLFKTSFKVGWLVVFIFKFTYLFLLFILKNTFGLFKFKNKKEVKQLKQEIEITELDESLIGNVKQPKEKSDFHFINYFKKKNQPEKESLVEKNILNNLENSGRKFKPKLKPILAFSFVLALLILPIKGFTYYNDLKSLKGRVLGASEKAIENIKGAADSIAELKFAEASDDFVKAGDNFFKAQEEIGEISGLISFLGSVIPNDDLKLAKNGQLILEAGVLSSKMGEHMTLAMKSLSGENFTVKNFINDLQSNSKEASEYADKLKIVINKIDPEFLPKEYAEKFKEVEGRSDIVIGSLGELANFLDEIKLFLGFDIDKRYLLVFQNNTEMRASGGFIGSYALVDIANGGVKKIEVPSGGSYDTEGGLFERVVAPEPLHLVNPLWHFWDANWWADWPTTAKKLEWFLDKSSGPTVDGVISFTPTVLERMLEIIGPIDMTEKYGVIITAENFWDVTQEIVEKKEAVVPLLPESANVASSSEQTASSTTEKEIKNEPKKIIGDLANKLLEVLPSKLNKETMLKMAGIIENSLKEKHILLYFGDENLENKAKEFGWDGSMASSKWDYLMVVNSNIAGQKTDRKIIEDISHVATVSSDGSIIDTVTIKRTHTGTKGEIFTGVRNVNWMRVYVPEGAKLIEAQGFEKPDEKYFEYPDPSWKKDPDVEAGEGQAVVDIKSGTKIYEENGKTVFANWSMLDPGQVVTITLKYELPFTIKKQPIVDMNDKIENFFNPTQKQIVPYALLAQKQPGSIGSNFNSELILSKNFKNIWQYPNDTEIKQAGWKVGADLKTDKYYAALIEIE